MSSADHLPKPRIASERLCALDDVVLQVVTAAHAECRLSGALQAALEELLTASQAMRLAVLVDAGPQPVHECLLQLQLRARQAQQLSAAAGRSPRPLQQALAMLAATIARVVRDAPPAVPAA